MKRYPLRSPEARRIIEQGPPWREPVEPPEPDEIPWHTEDQVKLSVARMKNWAEAHAVAGCVTSWHDITDDDWENLARVALGLRPR